jgi:uncharacterized protein (DUF362 family)/Pyruvate/2-oxoacid:ferredoxin oxidoreductase delta subunit
MEAVTRLFQQKGAEVWIGDSSGGVTMAGTKRALSASGMAEVCERTGARLVNFDEAGSVRCEGRMLGEFFLAKPLVEADLVVSMAKLKNHGEMIFTGAMKNLYGGIPGFGKPQGHKIGNTPKRFGEAIVDIFAVVKPGLSIIDGVIGMDGDGPSHGRIRKIGYLLASESAVAVDIAACRLVGYDPSRIANLPAAVERGIFPSLEAVEILGEKDAKIPDWKAPSTFSMMYTALGGIRFINDFFWNLQRVRPRISLERCTQCQLCVNSCPVEAIDSETHQIDKKACISCYCCHELCPADAVSLKKNPILERLANLWSQPD